MSPTGGDPCTDRCHGPVEPVEVEHESFRVAVLDGLVDVPRIVQVEASDLERAEGPGTSLPALAAPSPGSRRLAVEKRSPQRVEGVEVEEPGDELGRQILEEGGSIVGVTDQVRVVAAHDLGMRADDALPEPWPRGRGDELDVDCAADLGERALRRSACSEGEPALELRAITAPGDGPRLREAPGPHERRDLAGDQLQV